MKKKRKPRGMKKKGYESYDLCKGCYYRNCDPVPAVTIAQRKINRRASMGVCPGCGHEPCTCKSEGGGC